ncbi:MAG: hypothetical protein R3F13_02985 [Prosthecobacter sp.]
MSTGTTTLELRAILQINNNTGWTGSQAAAAANRRRHHSNSGRQFRHVRHSAAHQLRIDGTGIYVHQRQCGQSQFCEYADPVARIRTIINDAFDRSLI